LRLGVVLGRGAGALQEMEKSFRFGIASGWAPALSGSVGYKGTLLFNPFHFCLGVMICTAHLMSPVHNLSRGEIFAPHYKLITAPSFELVCLLR